MPGHEGIGRVGVPWLYSACGRREYCLSAWQTVCPDAQFGGYTKNGGFADDLLADPRDVARVPDGLTAAAAAPIICAGLTTYKGITVTDARPGKWLAVSTASWRTPRASAPTPS